MFIEALFMVTKTWEQPVSLSGWWIKKTWCIYTIKYYSAIRKDEILPFTVTWIHLEYHAK